MPLFAQFNSASLSGVIKDTSGSVVPDARVTVVNVDTRLTRTDTSGGDGAFLFPVLPVGSYRPTVEKAGFSTYVQQGITLAGAAGRDQLAVQRAIYRPDTTCKAISMAGAHSIREFTFPARRQSRIRRRAGRIGTSA